MTLCSNLVMQPAELIQSPVLASVSNCDDVSCGVEFTMWLCDGKVFSAGLPQYGQLGHNTDHEYNAKDCKHPWTCKLQKQHACHAACRLL